MHSLIVTRHLGWGPWGVAARAREGLVASAMGKERWWLGLGEGERRREREGGRG